MRTSPYAHTAEVLLNLSTNSTGIQPAGNVVIFSRIAAKGWEMSGASQEEIDLRLTRLMQALLEAANESDGLARIQIEEDLDPSAFIVISSCCRGMADRIFPPKTEWPPCVITVDFQARKRA